MSVAPDPLADEAPEEPGDDEGPSFLHVGAGDVRLVSALTNSLRVARLHAMENVAVVESVAELAAVLTSYLELRHKATILIDQERVYLNGRLVRGGQSSGWIDEFSDLLTRSGTGGLILTGVWDAAAVHHLLSGWKGGSGGPAERFQVLARAAERLPPPARAVVLDPGQAQAFAHEEEEGYLSETQRAAFYFARLVALAEATHAAVREGRPPDVYARNIRQTVMKLTDFLRGELFAVRLLGMTVQPPLEEDPLATHAANVTILAVAMGRLLGLTRGALADLGFAALFHDVGRAGLDRRPAADGSGEDPAVFQGHVIAGVSYALRARSYGSAGLLRIAVAQEHHRPVDGYPDEVALRQPHPFSRLVAVADAFDKLQQGTPWRGPVGPARALRLLREDPERYEPAVVDLLEDVLGRIPRGTLLRLRDGSVAVVIDGGAQRSHRPLVRRLLRRDGSAETAAVYAELRDPGSIAQELDPATVSVDWRRAVVG